MTGSAPADWSPVRGTPEKAVVLAVGDAGPGPALACAVAESARSGHPLHLLHVVPMPAAETVAFTVYDSYHQHAMRLMDLTAAAAGEALRRAGVLGPPTGEVLVGGPVVDDLVSHSREAHLLVMQHDRPARERPRWLTYSRTVSVAGRVPVPVLCVPPVLGTAHDGVTVAVQHPRASVSLLTLAVQVAARRTTALRVLHAWWLGDGHDALVGQDPEAARAASNARAALEATLAGIDLQGVSVRVEVRHQPPSEAVVDAGSSSSLLVVGRRDRRLALGGHLGHVARAAVDHAACPVLVSPDRRVAADSRPPEPV